MTIFAQLDRAVASTSPGNVGLVVTTFSTSWPASAFPDVQARLVVASAKITNGMGWDGIGWLAPPFSFAERQAAKLASLDSFYNQHFDFASFIRDGTVVTLTGTQIMAMQATIGNNYRAKRAGILAATTDAGLAAIDVTTGWPANP